jgi:hypothetical protein
LLNAKGPILVEGPFAANDVYIAALGALRPQSPMHPSLETLGTSLGAAMLVNPDLPTEIPPAAQHPNIDLSLYRAHWRTLSGAKGLLTKETVFFN